MDVRAIGNYDLGGLSPLLLCIAVSFRQGLPSFFQHKTNANTNRAQYQSDIEWTAPEYAQDAEKELARLAEARRIDDGPSEDEGEDAPDDEVGRLLRTEYQRMLNEERG